MCQPFPKMNLRFLTNSLCRISHIKQTYRHLHLTNALRINPDNVTEVRIPVPWGHIAGKWWGNTNEQPILALHGWQDNCGTFDPLLELLPDSIPVLAIDSPGHGFSSHYPSGSTYHNGNHVMFCRRIQKHFKWEKKITFLGHSEGGVIAFLFAAIYPEFVDGLITIDVVKPFAAWDEKFEKLGKSIDKFVNASRKDSSHNPKYTLEEIRKRWIDGTKGSLTLDAVNILLKRGVQLDEKSGKYSLIRDPKLKVSVQLNRFDENQSLELARNLRCNFLAFRCRDGVLFDYSLKKSPTFIDTVTEAANSFKIVTVDGTHHAHLNNAERFVPEINNFIQNHIL